jgi:transcriptional regulator with XRE-family HTH domain
MSAKKSPPSIVDQLRQAIARSGQTEYAIAQGSGVTQSVVSRFVNGERGINLETAARLCAYLDLQLTRRPGRLNAARRTRGKCFNRSNSPENREVRFARGCLPRPSGQRSPSRLITRWYRSPSFLRDAPERRAELLS